MKELFEVFEKDIKSENFACKEIVIYGIIAPLALILVCGLDEHSDKVQHRRQGLHD